MTPAARHQAAIEILDTILAGSPAEQALTRWARASRFAGSSDRAAVRDLVFDALRCRRSFAHLGGAETGRGLILGGLRARSADSAVIFTDARNAPGQLSALEAAHQPPPMPESVALDCPDWLIPDLKTSLGADFAPVMQALRQRAPVFLRVNVARATQAQAAGALKAAGIDTRPHPLAPTALEVLSNPRAIHSSAPYLEGIVELQDAASQAVIAALPAVDGLRVLDYCAGGGGKSLALAALGAQVTAHDAAPARMRDMPQRAARAGVSVAQTDAPTGRFDLVLTDVPCSGSGSWRRSPDGKWRLTPGKLREVTEVQAQILQTARGLVGAGGWLAYVTCSLLHLENRRQVDRFLERAPDFSLQADHRFTPLDGGDGFYLALLRRH